MNFRHDVALTMATSMAVVIACLLTWAACHWWYGRKLAAAAHRLHKSDKERHDEILASHLRQGASDD